MQGLKVLCAASVFVFFISCAAPPVHMPAVPPDEIDVVTIDLQFGGESKLKHDAARGHRVQIGRSIVINVPDKALVKNSRSQSQRELKKEAFSACIERLKQGDTNTTELKVCMGEMMDSFQQIGSAGKKRREGDVELADISEVIRAAESGAVNADYILQINEFDTGKESTVIKNLGDYTEVRDFIRRHPDLKADFKDGKDLVECKAIGAKLNAKLIDVKTGEIVWLGNHEVNEFTTGVSQVTVEISSRRYVSNAGSVRRFVERENTELARQKRYGKMVVVPKWEHGNDFTRIISGHCEQYSPRADTEMRARLSRRVAEELIQTIKVGVSSPVGYSGNATVDDRP